MSRRCLISGCGGLNPCSRHSSDEQDQELRRNKSAIREIEYQEYLEKRAANLTPGEQTP